MKILGAIVLIAAVATLVGCGNDTPLAPAGRELVGDAGNTHIAAAATGNSVADVYAGNFVALLSGEDAGAETLARGVAKFRLINGGNEVVYKVVAANILNVRMAHIHIAAAGSDGPIAVWLYPDAPPAVTIPGRFSGVLGEGVITDADLTGPLAGMTVADLVEKIAAGMAYVNVHTDQYPAGEIRGQITIP